MSGGVPRDERDLMIALRANRSNCAQLICIRLRYLSFSVNI